MRFRVNVHLDGAPRLLLERHPSGTSWITLYDSAHAHEIDAQYVAIFAPVTPAETLNRAVEAFNGAISAAVQPAKRRELPEAAE